MILSYIHDINRDPNNPEGVGAHYLRVLGFLGICKIQGYRYYHNIIDIGHNYNNDPEWSNKWDETFNISKHELCINDDDVGFDKNSIVFKTLPWFIHFYPHTSTETMYFNSIIEGVRKLYNEKNKDKSLKLFIPNKKNVAIHIRTENQCDTEPIGGRYIAPDEYIKIINYYAINKDNHVHIFTQSSYDLTKIKNEYSNISYHIDRDLFDTFHHFVNADVLIIARSALSNLAGLYNKNMVIYFDNCHPTILSEWINIRQIIN